jgi:alkylhydroperoxidase family enzyme
VSALHRKPRVARRAVERADDPIGDHRVSWLPDAAEGEDAFARVFGLRPNLFAAWRDFASLIWTRPLAPPVILQLAQLRVRQMHGLPIAGARRMSEALAAGWDEARVADLDAWWKSARFDASERACLRLAEQFVLDAKGITDAEVTPARDALGDAGLVGFALALAIFDGFARFQKMLGISAADAASPPSRHAERRVVAAGSLRVSLPTPVGADAIQSSALAHQPEALATFMKLYGTLWSRGLLDHSTKEMARIRSARTVDCGY